VSTGDPYALDPTRALPAGEGGLHSERPPGDAQQARGSRPRGSRPLVSVLLPVKDAAATLPEAMESLLAQELGDLEEVPAAGALVARMDADDVAAPDRLAAQVELLGERPDVGVASCLVEGFGAGGPPGAGMGRYIEWQNGLVTPEEIARERFVESPVAHPSVLARREVLLAAEGYREGPFPEDYDLWLRLLAAGVRFAKVPRVLLRWRDHAARASRTDPRYAARAFRRTKLEHLFRGPLADRPEIVFWGAGLEGKPFLRAFAEAGCPARLVVELHRRKIGQVIHGARVVTPEALPGALQGRPGAIALAAVGVPSARPEIRAALTACGLREGSSFFFLR
jgi:hypothetical protein